MTTRILAFGFLLCMLQAQERELLAICSRCASPTVFRKTGTGTANSVAEARMTPSAIRSECEELGNTGAALANCIREQTATNKIYRAQADCFAGTLSPIDGKQYRFAGIWSNDDIGGGRTKWLDLSTGKVVGRDNASDGLSLSQQWEVLCPGPLKISQRPAASQAPSAQAAARPPAPPPPPPVCNGAPGCTEVNSFASTITDFRTSTTGGYRLVTATIRFQNKLARPLILGYLSGSGVATDDRGNRFTMNENTGLRGMGFLRANQVDPKFILAAGQTADARVEFTWYPRANEIFGTEYNMEFSVREIVPVSPTQFRVGLEHPLRWTELGRPEVSAAPAPAAVAPAAEPAVAVVAPVDHCQGLQRCYNAGTFTAQVQQVTTSQVTSFHVLSFRVRFQNVSAQPLILAYKNGTSVAIDNLGNRYSQTRTNYARGIGVSGHGQISAEFIVQPGQSRDASFEVMRVIARTQIGTGFTWDVAVEQFEPLPGNQLRTLREYSLNFPDLTAANPVSGVAPGATNTQDLGQTVDKLKGIFRRKK
ncbi:MAG: hypothetical protein FJW20_10125 [Acidimicrobiia bacterium]|nr:hypothetical protein [Acidimicrobiia bacterium]